MKLSVSLPTADVEYLDAYAETQGLGSRSAALQKAVRLLRASELGAAYEDAWTEWAGSDDAALWDEATADGLA
jgi:Arc/MetJ-type ribon-helix-helix transcriptional regulator